MRVLHTSDWHIGKKMGRFDRTEEYREVLAEVADIANREKVDLVVNSGDVFDRPVPRMEDLSLGLESLIRLTDNGRRPVVAIAGNHDSPAMFEVLAPYLASRNVHLVGWIKDPEKGGVLDLETPGGRAVVSCFPFLREGYTFNVWEPSDKRYSKYADRLKAISHGLSKHAGKVAGTDAVTILVAHFLVGGAKVFGGSPTSAQARPKPEAQQVGEGKVYVGPPRGERPLHMGEAYAADPQAIPTGPQYVAMGHIHAPQPVPHAPVVAEYAGSLLEMDFGEAGEAKRVVVVEMQPGLPAEVKSVELKGGRRLLRPEGTWAEIKEIPGVYESYLDLTVKTDGPEPGLADRAREEFEYMVKVKADFPRIGPPPPPHLNKPWVDLYGDYYQRDTGTEAKPGLLKAFRELLEEAVANETS